MNNATTTTNTASVRGYKVFNSDWTCRGFQFEVGQTYSLPKGQQPIPCEQGFHFCEIAADCFNYYSFNPLNKVAIVEAIGDISVNGDKSCTNSIKVVEEVTWEKLLTIVNIGKGNSGYGNSGDRNSGYGNSGDRNSGYGNSGDRNSGYGNSGDRNSGDRNSGYCNSGDYNSGDYNSGYCNSDAPSTVRVFNREISREVWEGANIPLFFSISLTRFVFEYEMMKEEKESHKGWENVGGYLKTMNYKEAWQESYRKASQEDRDLVKKLPNFDAGVFFEITGIRVD